jgi:hypothetical protein
MIAITLPWNFLKNYYQIIRLVFEFSYYILVNKLKEDMELLKTAVEQTIHFIKYKFFKWAQIKIRKQKYFSIITEVITYCWSESMTY